MRELSRKDLPSPACEAFSWTLGPVQTSSWAAGSAAPTSAETRRDSPSRSTRLGGLVRSWHWPGDVAPLLHPREMIPRPCGLSRSPCEAKLCLVMVRRIPSKTIGQTLPLAGKGRAGTLVVWTKSFCLAHLAGGGWKIFFWFVQDKCTIAHMRRICTYLCMCMRTKYIRIRLVGTYSVRICTYNATTELLYMTYLYLSCTYIWQNAYDFVLVWTYSVFYVYVCIIRTRYVLCWADNKYLY